MKYLHLSEDYILYELPFSKGLQYQACLISSEGGEFTYQSTEELEQNTKLLESILSQSIDTDYEFA